MHLLCSMRLFPQMVGPFSPVDSNGFTAVSGTYKMQVRGWVMLLLQPLRAAGATGWQVAGLHAVMHALRRSSHGCCWTVWATTGTDAGLSSGYCKWGMTRSS